MPQNETEVVAQPSRYEAPKELYEQDSEAFPEDLYEEELLAIAAKEERDQALRVEV